MKKILITGATGFLGSRLYDLLAQREYDVTGTSRNTQQQDKKIFATGEIDTFSHWQDILADCECVIHAAGRAHILKDDPEKAAEEFHRVNCTATLALAEAAYAAGVKHFIFISSVGVNGDGNNGPESPFSEQSLPAPKSLYAASKYEAEKKLTEKYHKSSMGVTIIRPVLICGPDAPGNIQRLLKLVHSGIPLPFKNIKNKRSMASLDNVCDFIIHCVEHSESKGETYLFSDQEELSIGEIVSALAKGTNKSVRLFSLPPSACKLLFSVVGKKRIHDQLFGSISVNSAKSRMTGWTPVTTISETLYKTGQKFRKEEM